MIVKLKLKDADGKEYTMLFGTSYKSYLDQIKDFFYRFQKWIDGKAHPTDEILSIETSKSKWKAFGGLKWCEEKQFQQELNREGCHYSNDPDNPKPRQYSKMNFSHNRKISNSIMKWYIDRYNGREVVKT
jgi:hypothetical protein